MEHVKRTIRNQIVLAMLIVTLIGIENAIGLGIGNVVVTESATIKAKTYDLAIMETLNLTEKMNGRSKTATYSFSSTKKAIATVNKKGIVTAINAGTTKVTIKETKNGKISTVGTVKIIVHKSEVNWLIEDNYVVTTAKGALEKNPYQLELEQCVQYINPKAEYTWYSGDTKKLQITKDGKIVHAEGKGTTSVDIIIKESYKGKARKIGQFCIFVSEPKLEKKSGSVVKLKKGEEYNFISDMSFGLSNNWYVVLDDKLYQTEQEIQAIRQQVEEDTTKHEKSPIADFVKNSQGVIKANGTGTRYLYFFGYNWLTETYDAYMGYVKIVVK